VTNWEKPKSKSEDKINTKLLWERSYQPRLTSENGSREFTKRLRDRLAPFAMPVILPCFSVKKETILSDSPYGLAFRTMAGVTRQVRINILHYLAEEFNIFCQHGQLFKKSELFINEKV
jgi:hypothetical protein